MEIDIFSMGRAERDRKQFHTRLLGCSSSLMVIASLTGGDNIHPAVLTTLAKRMNMISRKQGVWKLLAAVEA